MADLRHVDAWIFDLDNTLYKAECALFPQIDKKMGAFIQGKFDLNAADARKMQKDYYVRYGTTMSGLMHEHNIEPDHFLDFVHDIDLSVIEPDAALGAALEALPGKKYIYTNGSERHAENVAGALGVYHHFDDVFDIKAASYTPKPHREPYEAFVSQFGINAETAVMFEDIADNLRAPHDIGMTTVLVYSNADWLETEPFEKRPGRHPGEQKHIHHATDDLTTFLTKAKTALTNI